MKQYFKYWKQDLPAGLVVFLVALPLCLGIGLASTSVNPDLDVTGVPNIFSGIVAGIVGGLIVALISGSRLGVSGPAAGLITIVLAALGTLGSFDAFLLAILMAGIIQVVAGFLKLGIIGDYFPSSVIKGMLAAIGITLILKEIPHAFGYDKDFFGDESLMQRDGLNTFSAIVYSIKALQPGAIVISVLSVFILILLERPFFKKKKLFTYLPGALIVVILGAFLNQIFKMVDQSMATALFLNEKHTVVLPIAKNLNEFIQFFSFPDFSQIGNPDIYKIAFTIALVASLETLLCVEATDKLDPKKIQTPTNLELKAQGFGNIVSGLIGGLPITQVIVRSSANINAQAQTKLSAIVHGALLFLTVAFIPQLLNLIPLASLAAILFMIGYKLARIEIFKSLFKAGWNQFLPFITTIIVVLLSDLLTGIFVGLGVAIFFILRKNYQNNYHVEMESGNDGTTTKRIVLSQEVTFLNKASILKQLHSLPNGSKVIVDGSKCRVMDFDVREAIIEFKAFTADEKNISVELVDLDKIQFS